LSEIKKAKHVVQTRFADVQKRAKNPLGKGLLAEGLLTRLFVFARESYKGNINQKF